MTPPIGGPRAGLRATAGPAIPDSVLHQYPIDEGSGQTLTDTEGAADISLNFTNWLSSSDYEGGYAVESDGTDDRGLDGTLGTFGSNADTNFAVELVLETSDTGHLFGTINSGGNQNMAIAATTSDAWQGSSGPITFALRSDAGDGSSGDFLSVESSQSVTDANLYHVIWNKTGNTAADQEIQINGSAESVVTNNDGFDETQVVDFDTDLAYFARNTRGSLDEYLAAKLPAVRWYGDSLTEQQKTDLWNRQPFS